MVVCTLCSCYPWEMLGLPPVWYKAAPYRSPRAVKDPRGVARRLGVSPPKETEIRVWDSTAETRFLVLPMRPEGTEGWSEQQLAELVTRDSMIGTGFQRRREHHRERRARHGRHGWFRQGRTRAERADVSYKMGGTRTGNGPRDGCRRRIQYRHLALLPRGVAARGLSHQFLLQEMAFGSRRPADRQGFCCRRRSRRRPRNRARKGAQARQVHQR